MYWLFGHKLKLSTTNKLLIYKVKPLTIMYDILSLKNCIMLTADMILLSTEKPVPNSWFSLNKWS
jgi:hypothetical protein